MKQLFNYLENFALYKDFIQIFLVYISFYISCFFHYVKQKMGVKKRRKRGKEQENVKKWGEKGEKGKIQINIKLNCRFLLFGIFGTALEFSKTMGGFSRNPWWTQTLGGLFQNPGWSFFLPPPVLHAHCKQTTPPLTPQKHPEQLHIF